MFEVGKVYHVKKFEKLPEKFPKCGLAKSIYEGNLICDTIVKVSSVHTLKDPDWGTYYKCTSCDTKKGWGFQFYLNEELLEEISDEKTTEWSGYFAYLMEWMEAHDGVEFYGMKPASFDEWLDNEKGV